MQQLRTWRTSRPEPLTLAQAGQMVGTSAVQFHRYESGTRDIPPARAIKIEEVTGIPRSVLCPAIFAEKVTGIPRVKLRPDIFGKATDQ